MPSGAAAQVVGLVYDVANFFGGSDVFGGVKRDLTSPCSIRRRRGAAVFRFVVGHPVERQARH
jgi:hypothetical protein